MLTSLKAGHSHGGSTNSLSLCSGWGIPTIDILYNDRVALSPQGVYYNVKTIILDVDVVAVTPASHIASFFFVLFYFCLVSPIPSYSSSTCVLSHSFLVVIPSPMIPPQKNSCYEGVYLQNTILFGLPNPYLTMASHCGHQANAMFF